MTLLDSIVDSEAIPQTMDGRTDRHREEHQKSNILRNKVPKTDETKQNREHNNYKLKELCAYFIYGLSVCREIVQTTNINTTN